VSTRRNKREELTAEELRRILRYDRDAGNFVWLVDPGRRARAGTLAGAREDGGSRHRICINGRHYSRARLALLYENGSWPARVVHINDDNCDDRLCNLREIPSLQTKAQEDIG
jgi:hypothetical protein